MAFRNSQKKRRAQRQQAVDKARQKDAVAIPKEEEKEKSKDVVMAPAAAADDAGFKTVRVVTVSRSGKDCEVKEVSFDNKGVPHLDQNFKCKCKPGLWREGLMPATTEDGKPILDKDGKEVLCKPFIMVYKRFAIGCDKVGALIYYRDEKTNIPIPATDILYQMMKDSLNLGGLDRWLGVDPEQRKKWRAEERARLQQQMPPPPPRPEFKKNKKKMPKKSALIKGSK